MNPKVNYLAVGAFVILLLLATIFFSLWLAFGLNNAERKIYLIDMAESVSGLTTDSAVKFNGVDVGNVTNIALGQDPSHVIIKISINANTPISLDTRATLISQGLTGLSYIGLSGGSRESPPLLAKPGQAYPVIQANPSLLLRLDSSLRKLTNSMEKMTNSVDYLLREENQRSVTHILQHLDQVTQVWADRSHDVDQVLSDMPKMMQSIQLGLDSINYQTLPNLNNSLLIMGSTASNFSNVLAELSNNPPTLLESSRKQALGPGE